MRPMKNSWQRLKQHYKVHSDKSRQRNPAGFVVKFKVAFRDFKRYTISVTLTKNDKFRR